MDFWPTNGHLCSFWQCLKNIFFPLFRYISIGDIAHVGSHPPNVAAVYHNIDGQFALPVGYDLVKLNPFAESILM